VTRQSILVVEDELLMRRVLLVALRSQGYETVEAATGEQALAELARRPPDAMILDLGLPDMDGVEVVERLREVHELPVIVLSARGEERHQIRALDAGANDYVVKPFREGELLARIRAALRRGVPASERREMRLGDLLLDTLERRVFVGEREVELTPTEFKLLHVLARESGRVVTHRQLLAEVWGPSRVDEVQYLRVYMKQLRRKLESDPARPERIVTTLGIGYRLLQPASSSVAERGTAPESER